MTVLFLVFGVDLMARTTTSRPLTARTSNAC